MYVLVRLADHTIIGGLVGTLSPAPEGVEYWPADLVAPAVVPLGHRCAEGMWQFKVFPEDRCVEATAVVEPIPLDELRVQLKARVAERRWQAETGGTTVNGIVVATDRETQAKLTGAALEADLCQRESVDYTLHWLTPAGFVTLTGTEVIALARAVRAHVQAAFDRQSELWSTIDAAPDIATLTSIDLTAGWPA